MALPTQQQILIPLLDTLEDLGGKGPPSEVYRALAERMEVSAEDRAAAVQTKAGSTRTWDRTVRWARQKAAMLGYIGGERFRDWEITGKGRSALREIRPGAVVTIFETDNGVALWAEASAAVRLIENEACRLILTSPPYPLLRKKEYSNQHSERAHVDWLVGEISQWMRPLATDGSMILNLGDAFMPGQPTMSLYQERLLLRLCDELGMHLCERLYWHNPSKMPSPAEWVTVRRVRVTPAVAQLFWISKTPHPYASNRNVLRAYSEAMQSRLRAGGEKWAARPSGYELAEGAFGRNNGGSIPHNLISIANTASNDGYARFVKERGLPQHPARFPEGLADWCIRLLTEPGDLVWDPFGGSMTTAAAAEKLGRSWVSNDKALEYLLGGVGRFSPAAVRMHETGGAIRAPDLLGV